MIKIIGVRFRSAGKVYYFDPGDLEPVMGDHVIVETARGPEYGTVSGRVRNVADDMVTQPLREVIRIATEEDTQKVEENRAKEKEALNICREKVRKHNLDMKLVDAEYSFDGSKILFYFTADGRIDFRDLVKDLASVFRMRIELRQIGVRDETKMLGGMGICGRELCCATYLSDFAPVSIKMAKEQNLSLNPAKISGTCGRLMCCLKNEEDTYEYLNAKMPKMGEEAGGYTSALLLGTRSLIPSEDRAAFAKLGIAHILSVSGFHTGVLVMLQALSALGSLVTAPGILKLQAIAAGVASICFGMLIFSFRDRCANPGFVEDAVKAEDVPLDTGKASSENGSFSEYAPFYEDSYAPAGEKRDAGYNSGEWTGYEPEKIQPVQGAVAASSQGLGVPDPYNTIVEPDPRFDPRFFQGNSEDTIVESYPGEFNSAGFANNAGYFNNINNKDVSGNAFGSETWIAYPEQPSEPAKPAAPVQNQRNESAFSQERLFSAAQDIQNGPSKDPFGDREKPVFSVQEQQFNGPEAAPQGNPDKHREP